MKKLALLLIMILLSVSTLAGCSFFTVDELSYYNAVVAVVAQEKITRMELLSAYNSYGKSQFQDLKVEEALSKTLDFLIDRQLLINYATENLQLTDYEIDEVCQNVLDYFDGQYAEYEKQARKILKIKDVFSDADNTESENEKYIPTTYTKRATIGFEEEIEVINMIPVVKTLNASDAVLPVAQYANADDFEYMAEKLYEKFEYTYETQEAKDKTEQLYLKALINGQRYTLDDDGKHLSKEKDDAFKHEFNNIYKYQYENALLTKIRTDYLNNHKIDTSAVINKYKQLVKTDQINYGLKIDDYYNKMQEDASAVYFHPDNEFFYVYNVLFAFDEEIADILKEDKKMVESGNMLQGDYELKRAAFAQNIAVKARNANGEQVGEAINAQEVYYNEIIPSLTGNYTNKLQQFNKYIYKYNSDPGMLNANLPYVIGKTHSKMVDEFNEAARALHNNGEGEKGALSALVLTDYGYHVIFYAGQVENYFQASVYENNFANLTLTALDNKYISQLREYTLFDKMFDTAYPQGSVEGFTSIAETGYSAYETQLVNQVSNMYDVTIFKSILNASNKI